MNELPFLLREQDHVLELPRRSLDFHARLSAVFGEGFVAERAGDPEILILTRSSDCEADAVGLRLASWGVPYLRIDADYLPNSARMNVEVAPDACRLSLTTGGRTLENLRAVWFRQFDATSMVSYYDEPVTESYLRAEWQEALRALLAADSSRWINHPDAVCGADRIRQLRLADEVGLDRPRTVVSNDPARIASFAGSCPNGIVTKVLGHHFVEVEPGRLRGVFPRSVDGFEDHELGSTALAPAIYQERVDAPREVRVTIVGRDLIAAEVGKADASAIWERPEEISVATHRLPANVGGRLLRFMTLAGLDYGAFDLLLTEDGRYVFLEVNPFGDWTWLESRNGEVRVTEKVASYLAELARSRA